MSPSSSVRRAAALAALAVVPSLATACLPYTVGTTAQTLPRGEVSRNAVTYFIPRGIDLRDDSTGGSATFMGMDAEARLGVGPATDVGIRTPGMSGVVLNVKHRLGADQDTARAAVAVMVGAGLVNWGNHAHLEATIIRSGAEGGTMTPYGGVRVMQVVPLNSTAVSDSPTAGVFAGVRIGTRERGISPEIGIFYDRSALDLRRSNIIVVPAVTLHGDMLRALRGR